MKLTPGGKYLTRTGKVVSIDVRLRSGFLLGRYVESGQPYRCLSSGQQYPDGTPHGADLIEEVQG